MIAQAKTMSEITIKDSDFSPPYLLQKLFLVNCFTENAESILYLSQWFTEIYGIGIYFQ